MTNFKIALFLVASVLVVSTVADVSEIVGSPSGTGLEHALPGQPDTDYPIYSVAPRTSFTCRGREFGYYVDTEARCQVFRVCAHTDLTGIGFTFLCPNGTLFNQAYMVCDWYYNVQCDGSEQYYGMNQVLGMRDGPDAAIMDAVHKMQSFPFAGNQPVAGNRVSGPNGGDGGFGDPGFGTGGPNGDGGNGQFQGQPTLPEDAIVYPGPGFAGNGPTQGVVSGIPAGTYTAGSGEPVYISNLGELSTDPNSFFDPLRSNIIQPSADSLPFPGDNRQVLTYPSGSSPVDDAFPNFTNKGGFGNFPSGSSIPNYDEQTSIGGFAPPDGFDVINGGNTGNGGPRPQQYDAQPNPQINVPGNSGHRQPSPDDEVFNIIDQVLQDRHGHDRPQSGSGRPAPAYQIVPAQRLTHIEDRLRQKHPGFRNSQSAQQPSRQYLTPETPSRQYLTPQGQSSNKYQTPVQHSPPSNQYLTPQHTQQRPQQQRPVQQSPPSNQYLSPLQNTQPSNQYQTSVPRPSSNQYQTPVQRAQPSNQYLAPVQNSQPQRRPAQQPARQYAQPSRSAQQSQPSRQYLTPYEVPNTVRDISANNFVQNYNPVLSRPAAPRSQPQNSFANRSGGRVGAPQTYQPQSQGASSYEVPLGSVGPLGSSQQPQAKKFNGYFY